MLEGNICSMPQLTAVPFPAYLSCVQQVFGPRPHTKAKLLQKVMCQGRLEV